MSSLQSAAIRSVRSHWVPRARLHPLLLSGLSIPAPPTRPAPSRWRDRPPPILEWRRPHAQSAIRSSLPPDNAILAVAGDPGCFELHGGPLASGTSVI